MRWYAHFGCLILSLLIWGVAPSGAQSSITTQRNSLFADHKAVDVGDVVTIFIMEFAKASNEATTSTSEESKSSSSGSGEGALDFIPLFGLEASTNTEYKGDGRTSRRGLLKAKITAKVIEKQPNGNLVIEGSRTVDINGEKQIILLSGIVRPEDITADNIIFSYNISEAKITYRGKGVTNSAQRPGLLTRLLHWIF